MQDVRLMMNAELVINQINKSLEKLNDSKNLQAFERWHTAVRKILLDSFSSPTISQNFESSTKVIPNKFSHIDTQKKLDDAYSVAQGYLVELIEDIKVGKFEGTNVIDREIALIIVRQILNNFYKHIEAMYQDNVHGNGSIKKEDLDKIQLGNEYDVQRMLYSLIRPVFPEARLEAVDDTGYGSVRYDIVLKRYNIIIEVKCTRQSMTERKLTEELGADAFHYKGDHLFMFVYDKVKLINNVDAFVESYTKSKQETGKAIETIVIQEVRL